MSMGPPMDTSGLHFEMFDLCIVFTFSKYSGVITVSQFLIRTRPWIFVVRALAC